MGSNLILNGRNTEKLESLKKELTAQGVEVLTLPFDVRDRKAMQQAVDSLQGQWKHVDVLINNAGLVIGMDKEHEGSLDEWDIVIDTNIKALLAMTRLIVPGTRLRTCHQYRIHCRRCSLCRRQRVLCNQSCCKSLVRRSSD